MPYAAQRDLRGKHPIDVFPYLVAVDGTGSLYDGTGSQITSLNVTSSQAISASYEIIYETSSSYANFADSSSFTTSASYSSASFSSSYAKTSSYADESETSSFLHPIQRLIVNGTVSDNIVTASAQGNIAFGYTTFPSSIDAVGKGSIAGGVTEELAGDGDIYSRGLATVAVGFANGVTGPAVAIMADGTGSVALGVANDADLQASGSAAFALGENVKALGNNTYAVGKNFTNSTPQSFKVGFGTVPSLTVQTQSINSVPITASLQGTASYAPTSSYISPSFGSVSNVSNATGSSVGTAGFTDAAELGAFILAVSSSFETLNSLIAKLRAAGVIT